jgi:hypothetical protein
MSNDNKSNCPHCGESLLGEPIPEQYLHYYGGDTHYKLEIGLEFQGVYDGVWEWMCSFCKGRWDSDAKLLRTSEFACKEPK